VLLLKLELTTTVGKQAIVYWYFVVVQTWPKPGAAVRINRKTAKAGKRREFIEGPPMKRTSSGAWLDVFRVAVELAPNDWHRCS